MLLVQSVCSVAEINIKRELSAGFPWLVISNGMSLSAVTMTKYLKPTRK